MTEDIVDLLTEYNNKLGKIHSPDSKSLGDYVFGYNKDGFVRLTLRFYSTTDMESDFLISGVNEPITKKHWETIRNKKIDFIDVYVIGNYGGISIHVENCVVKNSSVTYNPDDKSIFIDELKQ